MRRRIEWIQEGSPKALRVGADGDSARYPASAHDRARTERVFPIGKANPGGTAGVEALVPERTRVFLFSG